ncbi:MAG TPA: hypothetical protein VFS12_13505 [Terriglobia bacterium]|nr:hypothetical protein [Terriglobia bacterium]
MELFVNEVGGHPWNVDVVHLFIEQFFGEKAVLLGWLHFAEKVHFNTVRLQPFQQ